MLSSVCVGGVYFSFSLVKDGKIVLMFLVVVDSKFANHLRHSAKLPSNLPKTLRFIIFLLRGINGANLFHVCSVRMPARVPA